jgi:hypothetical protein
MTSKIYRSAQGKSVDLGTIMLQNEHVRAVGNMNVNARGDKLDNNNRVVETKPRQIQKQNARTTNVSADPVQTSTTKARKARKEKSAELSNSAPQESAEPVQEIALQPVSAPPVQTEIKTERLPEGGLAAAIARNREVKQELEKTRRQQQQAQGLRKI